MRTKLLALTLLLAPRLAFADEPAAPPAPAAEKDELDEMRRAFRAGMDRYRAEAYGEAIIIWTKIYLELGPEKGYRLAFNIGRAYDQIHDETNAAEHYEAYLSEVEARHTVGETLEPLVLKQEDEANERMKALRAKLGRIHVRGDGVLVIIDTRLAQVRRSDAYVTPGKHSVTFRPNTPDQQRVEITVLPGAVANVEAPPITPPEPVVRAPSTRWETREQRPYSQSLLWIGAGATALSLVVPLVFYVNAGSDLDQARLTQKSPDFDRARADHDTYSSAQTTAYASWALPAILGTATIALTAYWFLGKKYVRTPVQTALAF